MRTRHPSSSAPAVFVRELTLQPLGDPIQGCIDVRPRAGGPECPAGDPARGLHAISSIHSPVRLVDELHLDALDPGLQSGQPGKLPLDPLFGLARDPAATALHHEVQESSFLRAGSRAAVLARPSPVRMRGAGKLPVPRRSLIRLTWSLPPHPPAERIAA